MWITKERGLYCVELISGGVAWVCIYTVTIQNTHGSQGKDLLCETKIVWNESRGSLNLDNDSHAWHLASDSKVSKFYMLLLCPLISKFTNGLIGIDPTSLLSFSLTFSHATVRFAWGVKYHITI